MNESRELVMVSVALAIAVLAAAIAAARRATRSGPDEVTSRRLHLHQRSPRARVMVAITAAMLGLGVALFTRATGRPSTPPAGSADSMATPALADTMIAASTSEGPDRSGTMLALAIGIGVVTLALAGIVAIRSRNTRS